MKFIFGGEKRKGIENLAPTKPRELDRGVKLRDKEKLQLELDSLLAEHTKIFQEYERAVKNGQLAEINRLKTRSEEIEKRTNELEMTLDSLDNL